MKQRHGVDDAAKVSRDGRPYQHVTVIDGHDRVILSLGSADTPAGLTVEQARFIAAALIDAADRLAEKTSEPK